MPPLDDLVARLDARLPQTQCTRCGYPHCRAYAEALTEGRADINRCPPGGEVTLRALADQVLFGVEQVARQAGTPQEVGAYLRVQSEQTGVLVFILDGTGRVVQDLSPGAEFERTQLPVSLRDVQRQPNRWLAGQLGRDGDPLPFLARVVPVGRFGGGAFVAVAMPESSASDVAADLLPRLLASGLAGLAVALVVGMLLSRSVYTPLRRLTAAVGAVGRGRYDTRVPEAGPGEMRDLARAFNRMTADVEHNETTLRNFIADISHELRTPLTSIRGFTEALRDGTVADPARRQRSMEIIEEETRRMLRLVEQLLELSRLQAGQSRLERDAVDVAELLQHVAAVFAQRAAEAGLTLTVEAAPRLPPLTADYDRLVQVCTNLVDNALQHTREGGITLRAERDGAWLHVTVADTGPGVPPEDLPHLFERFYRAGNSRARGTGLGLAIAREIVRAHGGEISVTSTPGAGTRFGIRLPWLAGQAEPTIAAPA